MSILRNIFQAIKGGASQAGEAIVDSNLIRILEQDIRDDGNAINKAKQSLTNLKSTEINLKRKLESLSQDISDYEGKAVSLLESGNEALATETAERIAEIETDYNETKTEYDVLAKEVTDLNKLIKNRAKNLEKNKRELEKVKTVGELQKASASINNNLASTGSTANSVRDSLARVKEKQQKWKDRQKAGEWMEDESQTSDLDQKLADAGVSGSATSSASSVLERLRSKNTGS